MLGNRIIMTSFDLLLVLLLSRYFIFTLVFLWNCLSYNSHHVLNLRIRLSILNHLVPIHGLFYFVYMCMSAFSISLRISIIFTLIMSLIFINLLSTDLMLIKILQRLSTSIITSVVFKTLNY